MTVGEWSLDHILVDQRGVPTLVEAKLLQNSEARRAVVGQIMEYAANAEGSWGAGRLRQLASEYWAKAPRGKDLDAVLRAAFPEIDDVEAFWEQVEANLKQGRLRLIIAADELRPEIRRIIEFLNQQLRTVQIFGLEIRCFTDNSGRGVIVPFLVGQTQAAADAKGTPRPTRSWTIEELRHIYTASDRPSPGAARLLDWAVARGCAQPAKSQMPLFYLRGRVGNRVATVYPNALYVWLRASAYPDASCRATSSFKTCTTSPFSHTLRSRAMTDGTFRLVSTIYPRSSCANCSRSCRGTAGALHRSRPDPSGLIQNAAF